MVLKQQKEINILLLGETGVGKSTFINAFANYLTYDTLKEAEKVELICLIPTEFTVTDADYKEQRVKIGSDANEVNIPGRSATQQCKAYCFKYGDILVRLIDTPGVGDTNGIKQDKVNFADFLTFIGEYNELHLICILLKPNNSRITVTFEFCVKQLLCHLQKDASKNMVFLFTNARDTFYRPGDTSSSPRSILEEIRSRPPNAEIPMEKKTIYCLDNESFRFLVALFNKIEFMEDERSNFSQSWTKSVTKCQRLINYIIEGVDGLGLPPHKVKDTISINDARRLIVGLSQPIADITSKIEETLKKLAKHENEIRNYKGTITDLKSLLYVPKFEIKVIPYVFDVPVVNILAAGFEAVRNISHYNTYHSADAVEKREKVNVTLKGQEDAKKAIEKTVKVLQETSFSYLKERRTITKHQRNLPSFLRIMQSHHTMTPIKSIWNKKLRIKRPNQAIIKENVKGLQKIIDDYEKEKEILEEAIVRVNMESYDVSAEEIISLVKQLYELKLTGPKI